MDASSMTMIVESLFYYIVRSSGLRWIVITAKLTLDARVLKETFPLHTRKSHGPKFVDFTKPLIP